MSRSGYLCAPIAAFGLSLSLVSAGSSFADIIRGADAAANLSAPVDDPGWANVGQRGGASAVYLGNRWVLTAAHVGAGSVVLNGSSYNFVSGTQQRLHEPTNASAPVDLLMFQIDRTPVGLRDLAISRSAPAVGATVLAMGYGRARYSDSTAWYVDTSVRPYAWRETPIAGATKVEGFKLSSASVKSWGENQIDVRGYTTNYGMGNTYYLQSDFDALGGRGNNEMSATPGDSGGALFYKNGDQWELAGIQIARRLFYGQPSNTVAYGNQSLAADLSRYWGQILGVVDATPGVEGYAAGSASPVPEPSSITLLVGLAIAAVAGWGLRRRREP